MNTPRPPEQGSSLRRMALLFGSQELLTRVTAVLLSLFAARTLGPGEVGRLGLAVIVSALISMLASYPESAAVFLDRSYGVSRPAREGSRLRGAITILLVVLVVLGIGPVADLLGNALDPRTALLVRLMLVLPCLEAAGAEPRIRAQRALHLSYLGRIQVGGVLSYVGLSFLAVAFDFGVLGMTVAQLVATFGTTLLLFRFVPRTTGEETAAAHTDVRAAVLRNSLRLFVGGFGGFLGARLDNILVARVMGGTGLGLYSMAWSASRLGVAVITGAMNSILGPLLPQMGVDGAQAAAILKRGFEHFILAAGAFSSALVIWAPALVSLVLGEKWLQAIPAMQLMAISAFCTPIVTMAGLILTTSGRAHWIFWMTVAHLASLSLLVPRLAREFGVAGGALGEVFATLVATSVILGLFRKQRVSVAWLDRPALAWSLAAMIPSVLGASLVNTEASGIATLLAIAASGNLGFVLIASRHPPFRAILGSVATHGGNLRRSLVG